MPNQNTLGSELGEAGQLPTGRRTAFPSTTAARGMPALGRMANGRGGALTSLPQEHGGEQLPKAGSPRVDLFSVEEHVTSQAAAASPSLGAEEEPGQWPKTSSLPFFC